MKSVRANLPLLFFTFMVCLNQKRKKGRDWKRKEEVDVGGGCHCVSLWYYEFFHRKGHWKSTFAWRGGGGLLKYEQKQIEGQGNVHMISRAKTNTKNFLKLFTYHEINDRFQEKVVLVTTKV